MSRDRIVDLDRELPANADSLRRDLELDPLLDAMAGGDDFLLDTARQALYASLTDPDEIAYRQDALRDALREPAVIRDIYALTLELNEGVRKVRFGLLRDSPGSALQQSIGILEVCFELLPRLRKMAEDNAFGFDSEAFTNMFSMLSRELDDAYLEIVEDHLKQLKLRHGVSMSARLGPGNRGRDHVLREPRHRGWWERIGLGTGSSFSFQLHPRDQAGSRTLRKLRDLGLDRVANVMSESADHVLAFFAMLRSEIGFYVACVNLSEKLGAFGATVCFPEVAPPGRPELSCRGLYDVCLRLESREEVVGNDLEAGDKSLLMITGANRGGKSTFLRSLGLAQLMMQCGMFVPAESFRADLRSGIFTHFKREEDSSMESGKLDEELARMSEIVDLADPGGLLLCNESFASTNEREGSEISRQIIAALLAAGVKVAFVTHMFDLADSLYEQRSPDVLFLRAERREDGGRTFRLLEGEPLPTSFGIDLYRKIFGHLPERVPQ